MWITRRNSWPNRNSQITGWTRPAAMNAGWRRTACSVRPVRYQVCRSVVLSWFSGRYRSRAGAAGVVPVAGGVAVMTGSPQWGSGGQDAGHGRRAVVAAGAQGPAGDPQVADVGQVLQDAGGPGDVGAGRQFQV